MKKKNYLKLLIVLFFSYCNAVSLVDLFRFSNMYVCTTKIRELARNKSRYEEAINIISRPSKLLKLHVLKKNIVIKIKFLFFGFQMDPKQHLKIYSACLLQCAKDPDTLTSV